MYGREFGSSFLRTKGAGYDELESPKGYRLGEKALDVTLSPDYAKIAAEKTVDVESSNQPKNPARKYIQLLQIVKQILKK